MNDPLGSMMFHPVSMAMAGYSHRFCTRFGPFRLIGKFERVWRTQEGAQGMNFGNLRAATLFLALIAGVFSASGCQSSTSDSNLVGIRVDDAMQLVQGKKSLPFMTTKT